MILPLADLSVTNPVLVAPMAGGPTVPGLVVAAARAGSLNFLAGGYKTVAQLADQISDVRSHTATFGVNLFAPNPVPVDRAAFRHYARYVQREAEPYDIRIDLEMPIEDDDSWNEKIELLVDSPVPVVSFTFGIPDRHVLQAFRRAGITTIQTVTSNVEARLADEAGVDVLAVQASAAGGHSGTLTPERIPNPVPLSVLLASVQEASSLPLIAAGGLSTPLEVAAALGSGADAVMVGTVLLRSAESGASVVHKAAIADHQRGATVITRAFTGRPARALPNAFLRRYASAAPLGYPAIHHLTSGLRRAAAAAGNAELVNLWAGTGYRQAAAEPVDVILSRLSKSA